jgi:hypothetical protein
LLTTKDKYMVATHGRKETIWLHQLCLGIGFDKIAMMINFDSQSEILLAKNPVYHSRTKNIDVQYHFVRSMVEKKKVLIEKVDTLENIAYSLTKYVSVVKFSWCRGNGNFCLGSMNRCSCSHILAKNITIGRMLGCYILCSETKII